MAKNKGTHGRGKVDPELTEPDEFVQRVNSFSDTIAPHWKKIAFVGGLVAAGIVAWQVMGWLGDKAAKKATVAYVSTMKVLEAPVIGPEDTQPTPGLVPTKSFPTEEARVTESLQALDVLESEYGDVELSAFAVSRRAKLLLEAGRFDEAKNAFGKVVDSSVPDAIRMAAREGIGYSLEGKAMSNNDASARQAGLGEALKAFADLQPNEGGPMRDYSLFHQGRILVAMGKRDEGIQKYKQVLTELPDSPLTYTVESRLDGLDASE